MMSYCGIVRTLKGWPHCPDVTTGWGCCPGVLSGAEGSPVPGAARCAVPCWAAGLLCPPNALGTDCAT